MYTLLFNLLQWTHSPDSKGIHSHHTVKAICWPIAKIYGNGFLLEKMLLTHLAKKFIAYMKLKVHFHAHKGQHLELILHQINSVHTILLISLTSTFISSFHLQCLSLSSNLFSSDFSTKTLELFFKFPIQVTSSYHTILLDFISIQIYGKQYKFRRFPTLLQASFFFWHYNPW